MALKTALKTRTAIASLSIAIADRTGKEVQLLPAGRFKSVDGRPASMAPCKEWVMDAAAANVLIAAANARQDAYVIDYEHQTLLKEQNGQPAPAAGWFKGMEWREGVGLFGLSVEWTPKAAQAIQEGEYRYISPVIRFNPDTGRVTGLTMAALTNYAGIDGMQQASLAKLNTDFFNDDEIEEPEMNALLAALLKTLGLSDKATESEAMTALTAYAAKVKESTDKVAALTADLAAAVKPAAPDPAKFVPIETVAAIQSQLAALSAQINGGEVDTVVQAALAAGKLLPVQEAWARGLGKSNLPALKEFIEKAPAIAALVSTQSGGKAPDKKEGDLSPEQMAVCKAMAIKPEDYKKQLAAAGC
jgi:phage I-like protein